MLKQIILLAILFIFGCATFRSEIDGEFIGDSKKNLGAEKTSVVFVMRHLRQSKGFDAIPKLDKKHQVLSGFGDILLDATNELSNLDKFASFTDYSTDISEPKRLALKDSLITNHEYMIEIEIKKEWSFPKHFLGTLGSVLSATLFPIPYTINYSADVDVFDKSGLLKGNYQRKANTILWVEALLLPIYPFHTEKRKTEEIYVEFLHDIFKQIESENILSNS